MPDDNTRLSGRALPHVQSALGHAMATATVVGATLVVTVLAYFGLLAWAVLMNEPMGGALALPFILLLALVGSTAAVILVLFPSTLLAHVARRRFRWPLLTEIPIATAASLAMSGIVAVVAGALLDTGDSSVGLALAGTAVLLIPLGLYWWTLQGTTWGLRALRTAWCRLFVRRVNAA